MACTLCGGKTYLYVGDTARPCECRLKEQRESSLKSLNLKAKLPLSSFTPADYMGTTSIAEVKKLQYYVQEYKNLFMDQHLYIWGANSTQKTTMTAWLGQELLLKGVKVRYTYMDRLIKLLMDAGWTGENQKEDQVELNECVQADCLILDESFDMTKVTLYKSGYQLTFLDNFLRDRLERMKLSTIFISNVSPEELNVEWKDSIIALVQRNVAGNVMHFQDKVNININMKNRLWLKAEGSKE